MNTSRELLREVYALHLKKNALQQEISQINAEMESTINKAFRQLPIGHDPQNWLMIEGDVIARWIDPEDNTHMIEFTKIY